MSRDNYISDIYHNCSQFKNSHDEPLVSSFKSNTIDHKLYRDGLRYGDGNKEIFFIYSGSIIDIYKNSILLHTINVESKIIKTIIYENPHILIIHTINNLIVLNVLLPNPIVYTLSLDITLFISKDKIAIDNNGNLYEFSLRC